MTELEINESELGRRSTVPQPTINRILSGESSSPRRPTVEKLAKALRVAPDWLMFGGEDARSSSNVSMIQQPDMMFRYPVISWVAAGAWSEAVEPFPPGFSDRYEISEYEAKGNAFWLEVKGDSMTSISGQSVPEGTFILVDPEADVQSGKLVIAKMSDSNEATFKKLVEDGGRRFLKPLNPAYPTEMCTDGCRIVGVVVRALMKL
jgi:SOS-response transcriptional repressor LexA